MSPPDTKNSVDRRKTKLQTYQYSLDQNNEIYTIVITVNENDEDPLENADITYFVDEEGQYYYQSTEINQETEEIAEESMLLVEGDNYQTMALMPLPSESSNDEVSYLLIMQDDDKPIMNVDIKVNQMKSLSSVEYTKSVGKRFNCSICSYSSHRRYILMRHMKKHSEDRPYACSICERGFKTLSSLQNHENMHNGIKPHECKYCKRSFTTSGEVVRHVRYRHTHEKPHKCTECDYASVELSKLRRHMRCHTGERPYQCPNCTYASQDMFKLKRHLRTHTGEKPYKCEICNMCFTQSNTLKTHKLIHNVVQKPVFPCELCPTKCGRKVDLRNHVQNAHTSNIPIKCKKCDKSFPDKYTYKMHNKTHEGEKCFKCELCPYASATQKYLESHRLKHFDMKPFICDQCGQSFRQKQMLRRHQNLHHNPNYVPKPPKEKMHKCYQCRRRFALKGNLIRHLSIHDPDSGQQPLTLKLERAYDCGQNATPTVAKLHPLSSTFERFHVTK